jgi:hypothetical protein
MLLWNSRHGDLAEDDGRRTKAGGRRPGGRRPKGRRPVDGGQRAAARGRWPVDGGQRAGSGQRAGGGTGVGGDRPAVAEIRLAAAGAERAGRK